LSNLMIHGHNGDASRVQMNPSEDQPTRAIPLASRSESLQKYIFKMGWLSTSIVHDLKNPLGTISAGAEMLMELNLAPTEVKRLAANMHRAAGRMRELLADLGILPTQTKKYRMTSGPRDFSAPNANYVVVGGRSLGTSRR
jgi:His Kinase A (phospho-acceptor) domain